MIRSCRDGDERAWERLLERYERLVYSIPLNYGLSHEDAADVTQLTFTILMQSFDKLQKEDRLGSWLATVARRHTWRVLDSRRREGPSRDEDLAGSAALLGKSDADPLERWELAEWLDNGLSLLDERCRELLLALYFDPEQPSYAEISTRSGMPVGSIGPTRARCLKRLKQALLGR